MASPGGMQKPRRTTDGSQFALSSPGGREKPRGVLSDRYQIGQELGRGAFGHVYQAMDVKTKEWVAIKQLSLEGISDDALKSIMLEIELLKNLNHKNIVKYIGSFKNKSHLYIILEYMENGALSKLIRSSEFGAFPESLVAAYISQVLQGLAYLHDQGVVHRDIKGANILTTKEGLVKLADFGVAARLSELELDRDKTSISVVGTPYWMAPEVIEMTSVTPASDIWSVACLAIELVTGAPPYFDLQPMSALFRIVQDERPEYPNDLSADMKDFLSICFHKDPQKRPSARGLLRHRWMQYHRATLRSSWTRTQGMRSRGQRPPTEAHTKVSVVVDRILQADASELAVAAEPGKLSNAGSLETLPVSNPEVAPSPRAQTINEPRSNASIEPRLQEPVAQTSLRLSSDADQAISSAGLASMPAAGLATAQGQPFAASPSIFPSMTLQPDESRSGLGEEPATERRISSRHSSRANSLMLRSGSRHDLRYRNGPLEFLLGHCGPPTSESGEDLTQWLAFREEGRDTEEGQEFLDTQEDDSGVVSKHQEIKQLRGYLNAWRRGYRRQEAEESSKRSDEAIAACQSVSALLKEDHTQIETFLSEDGPIVAFEILQDPCSEKLATQCLIFINELICMDLRAFGHIVMLGGLPLITRYATGEAAFNGGHANEVRLQAAYALQTLAYGTVSMTQLLVTCQGLNGLVRLVETDFQSSGPLIHIGVNSIWSLLELQGMSFMKKSSRLLAASGFPDRVVGALKSTHGAYILATKMSAGKARRSESVKGTYSEHSHLDRMEEDLSGRNIPRDFFKAYAAIDATAGIVPLMTKMAKLILALSYADTEVKGSMCSTSTIQNLFSAIEQASESLQLIILSAVKRLSTDPSMLDRLERAQAIQSLGKYLRRDLPLPIQVEALHALHNLCKISRQRQEEAARVNLVPYLMSLARTPRKQAEAEPLLDELRQMAISLVCGMVHATDATRNALRNEGGVSVLLELLKEEDWQGSVLDALAAWMVMDFHRMEMQLTERGSVDKFVALFNTYRHAGGSNSLARLLEPFLKILKQSPQLTVELAVAGLPGPIVQMLTTANALTALHLLQIVHVIYEHHPRPKEFVAKYDIVNRLNGLKRGPGEIASVIVKKRCDVLLQAFQLNSVF